MAVTVGDFVRLTAKFLFLGTDQRQNVFLYRIDRNDAVDDDAFMVDAALFLDINYTLINGLISNDVSYVSVDGQNISKNELLPEKPWPVLVAGNNISDNLPGPVAAFTFWPTITPRVRTSTFIPGFTISSMASGGAMTAPAQATVLTFAQGLKDWNTVPVDAVKGSFNPTKLLFTPAGDPVVPVRFRTQRRRRVGVGA